MPVRIRNFKIGSQRHARIYDQQGYSKTKTVSKERNRKNFRRLAKLFFLALIFGLVIFLIIQIPQYINKVSRPFKNIPGSFSSYSSLNNNYRTNILLVSFNEERLKELAVASISQTDPKVTILTFDPSSLLELGSKVRLSELLTFEKGNDFPNSLDKLELNIIKVLAYPFDGYIALSSGKKWIQSKSVEKLADNLYSFDFFANILKNKDFLDRNLRTNLTISQLFDIVNRVKSLKPERFNFIDLAATINSGSLDTQLAKNKIGISLLDSKISAEGATVEVINASGVEGVGNLVKNMITNLGGNVVQISSSAETKAFSEIYVKSQKSPLGNRLGKILNKNLKDLKNNQSNIDIKVTLGQDFGKNFDF